eukprot:TRINITY_DN10571_c0_g1_i3.p1 TRINITY_DN10571_c0_g1~~TRINITY_DN10571_c0_g1_i3.p1  ORF type:complete len:479 (+),score=89.39 TRINITY_DN10571_c0_g1_i3:66-1502(+)
MPQQHAPIDWFCRWCKTQDGTPFCNFGWRKHCGMCRISKGASHGSPARLQDPTQSPTRSLATMAAQRAITATAAIKEAPHQRTWDSMAATAALKQVQQRSTNLKDFPGLDVQYQSPEKKKNSQQTQARPVLGDITNLPKSKKQSTNSNLSTGQRIEQPLDAPLAGSAALAPSKSPGAASLSDSPVAPLLPQGLIASESTTQVPAESGSPEHGQDASDQATLHRCSEYELEIVACLFAEEMLHVPRPDYMTSQPNINGNMRAILVDWLMDVHRRYKLRQKTLHLAVSLVDRYLAEAPVLRKHLQLVGVTCMFIAAKFEEICSPIAADFVNITANTYTKEEILSMESTVLVALNFCMVVPTQADFLEYVLKENQCHGEKHKELLNYLLDLALVDLSMIKHAPSKLVSAALLLSNEIMGRPGWPHGMAQITRYLENHVRGCSEELRALLRADRSSSLQAVRTKYLRPQHCCIAKLPEVLAA